MYPLGSCTMKYNPRVNEFVSRLEGIAEAHPYQPEALSQGSLGILDLLQEVPDRDHGDGCGDAIASRGGARRVNGILLMPHAMNPRGSAQEDSRPDRRTERTLRRWRPPGTK